MRAICTGRGVAGGLHLYRSGVFCKWATRVASCAHLWLGSQGLLEHGWHCSFQAAPCRMPRTAQSTGAGQHRGTAQQWHSSREPHHRCTISAPSHFGPAGTSMTAGGQGGGRHAWGCVVCAAWAAQDASPAGNPRHQQPHVPRSRPSSSDATRRAKGGCACFRLLPLCLLSPPIFTLSVLTAAAFGAKCDFCSQPKSEFG